MATKRVNWNVEVTDTFAGEANYCWVRRYTIKARSPRGAANALSRMEGYRFRADYNDGDSARYNALRACVCAFISYADNAA